MAVNQVRPAGAAVPRVRRVKLVADQGAAVAIAALFLAVGVAGFVPGLTSHVHRLPWWGHHPDGHGAQLLGAFDTSVAHNLMHLAFGVAGLLAARTFAGARWYLIIGGLIYLALWLYGTFSSTPREALPLNGSDNWLHFAIGVVMVILGLTLGATRVPTGAEGEILVPE